MGVSITERLSQAETRLLQAVTIGAPGLDSIPNHLMGLLTDIDHEIQTTEIDEKTMAARETMAWRLVKLSEQLLDIHIEAETMFSHLQTEMEDMFSRITIHDATDEQVSQSQPTSSPQSRRSYSPTPNPTVEYAKESSSNPPYIEPAYFWLLNNLHNPYPSKETKEQVAYMTSSDIKAVDSWFIDARKRIGWNKLRRQHFSNRRVDIVDAATRFFLHPDEKRPLDVNIEVELAAIEKGAEDLYSDRFTNSTLALKLGAAVQDLTPETKAQAKEKEQRRKEREADQTKQATLAAASYPSPAHSPGRTSSPFDLLPLLDEDPLPTERIAGQKHHRSEDSEQVEDLIPGNKTNKRTRLDSSAPTFTIGLLSPAPSIHETLEVIPEIPHIATSLENRTAIPPTCRKRRLSESECQGVPKRPRNLPVGPRLHTVSDPLPMSTDLFEVTNMDNWFQSNFGLYNTAQVDALDTSFPLDVEVFDYSALGITSDLFAPTATLQPLDDSPSLHTNNTIPSCAVEVPSSIDQLVISSKDIDYEDLFCDYTEVNSVSAITSTMFQPSALNFTSPGTYSDTQPTIPDLDFLYQRRQDKPQHAADIISTLNSSAMFDTSLMGSDPLDASLDSLFSQANKAAKQQMLEEMREATRRLEAEIAASS